MTLIDYLCSKTPKTSINRSR